MTELSTTQSPLSRVQQLAVLSTRLSWQLYNFSSSVSLSTSDINDLAGQINTLSAVLRQVSSCLNSRNNIASISASQDICEIVEQCRAVFQEIESIAPVHELPEPTADGVSLAAGGSWAWDSLPRGKVLYLLSYLNALSCTLSAMAQTFYAGQVISSARRDLSQVDMVINERMEIQSLVVKQQMSLIKTSRLFQEFQQSRPMTPPMEISTGPHSGALILFEGHCPHPQSLVPYQEKSLADSQYSFTTDIESMAQIRSVSDRHVDNLLRRWTNLSLTEKDLSMISVPSAPTRRDLERRLSQQATVESDDETDADTPKLRSPTPRTGGNPGPVLDYADPGRREQTSPIAVPGASRRRSSASIPETFSHWGYSSLPSSSFPQRPYHASGLSPTSSQTPPLTRSTSMPSSPTQIFPSGPGSITSTHSSHTDPDDHLGIPYRLRLHGSCWDFLDGEQVHSNTNVSHTTALHDSHTVTEIRESWIDADALHERKLPFGMITRSVGDDRKTKLRSFYCVERALGFREVSELVERSSVLVERKKRAQAEKRERRRSSATSRRGRPPTDSQLPRSPRTSVSNFTPQWAPTEEEYHEENYERSHKEKERRRRASSSGPRDPKGRRDSGNTEKETDRRASSTGRRRDSTGKESPERDQERESPKQRRRGSTLRTMAEGAGVAAIITGLAEMAEIF